MSAWLLPSAAVALWAGLAVRPVVAGRIPWLATLVASAVLLFVAVGATSGRAMDFLAEAGLVRGTEGPVEAVAPRAAHRRSRPLLVVLAALAAGVFLLGVSWGCVRDQGVASGVLATSAPSHVEVIGALRTDPEAGAFGWSAQLNVSRVELPDGAFDTREAVWINGDGPPPSAARGDRAWASGTANAPDEEGFGDYLRSRGIAVELSADAFRRLGPSSSPFVRLAGDVREGLARSFQRFFDPEQAGLLMGLALGDTSGLDPGMERDFRATGLSHLLAVSGGNVAMVLGPVMAAAMAIRLSRWPRFVVGVATVSFFVVLTGAEPSVLRAGVMAGIALVGVLLGRPRSTWSVLGGAVVVLLILDPFLVSSVGFQLSVAATVGMVALAGPLAIHMGRVLPPVVAAPLGTSLAAQLGVAPLLLGYFKWIPLVTILANLAAFPVVAPALILGFAAAGVGLLAPALGSMVAHIASLPIGFLVGLADRLASAPIASVTSGGGAVPLVAGTAVFIAIVLLVRGLWRPPRIVLVVAVALLPLLVVRAAIGAGPPSDLTLRFFDVGQGDGALISSPAGVNVLVDGGPDPDVVAGDLAALGVKRVDVLVATHPHEDHLAGLPDVLARFPVGLVLEPGCDDPSPSYQEFRRAVEDESLTVRHARAGDVFAVGDLTLRVLSPPGCFEGTNSDANNDSLVFMLEGAGGRALFPGDAEAEAQQALLDAGVDLRAEVLKVPHHGGATSLPAFLEAVDPVVAVIQVGQPNDYGHPVPEMVEVLGAAGARVLRNDTDGDVTVILSGQGVAVESAAS